MTESAAILAVLSLAFALIYVLAEWFGGGPKAWTAKILASSCFVVLAVINEPSRSSFGIIMLAALVLSWLGDVLLLSLRNELLLAGIAAFLLAHVAFGSAFLSLDIDLSLFVAALGFWNIAALLLLTWLWKHLAGNNRFAVVVYLAAISVVASLAFATRSPVIALAAIMFAVSDISVARDRFVERSIINRAWGIPLYYLAQVLFALSILPELR